LVELEIVKHKIQRKFLQASGKHRASANPPAQEIARPPGLPAEAGIQNFALLRE